MATTVLRELFRQAIRIRNLSARTEEIYIQCVARFALFFHRSPDRLGRGEIEQYLLFLRDVKRVSWAWFNQVVCALRFFYLYVLDRPDLVLRIPYGRRERHLPVVLSVDELIALLSNIDSLRDRVLLTLLYSAGLRLGEVCRLRIADIDSARMLIAVRQGKGKKDRYVPLSPITLDLTPSMVARHPSGRLPLSEPEGPLAPSVPLHRAARRQGRRSARRHHQAHLAAHAPSLCRVPGYAESVPFPRLFLRLAGRHNPALLSGLAKARKEKRCWKRLAIFP